MTQLMIVIARSASETSNPAKTRLAPNRRQVGYSEIVILNKLVSTFLGEKWRKSRFVHRDRSCRYTLRIYWTVHSWSWPSLALIINIRRTVPDQRLLLLDGDAEKGRSCELTHYDTIGVLPISMRCGSESGRAAPSARTDRFPCDRQLRVAPPATEEPSGLNDPCGSCCLIFEAEFSRLECKIACWSCFRRGRPGRNFRRAAAARRDRWRPLRPAPSGS